MIPWQTLDRATIPGYGELTLHQRGALFVIRLDGAELMGSHDHGSEELLASVACEGLATRADARVLVGGLGLGYTLRAALDAVGPTGRVDVAELVGATVRWNRGPLAHLAGRPLDDPRANVIERDVVDVIAAAPGHYDAILLDVDNGPDTGPDWGNRGLYSDAGLRRIQRALRRGGCAAIWAASETPRFIEAMRRVGWEAQCVRARQRGTSNRHVVWLGRDSPGERPAGTRGGRVRPRST